MVRNHKMLNCSSHINDNQILCHQRMKIFFHAAQVCKIEFLIFMECRQKLLLKLCRPEIVNQREVDLFLRVARWSGLRLALSAKLFLTTQSTIQTSLVQNAFNFFI